MGGIDEESEEAMMSDYDFAVEFVRRIKRRSVLRNSAWDLILIVENGVEIPEEQLLSDVAIERLYSGNNVYQDVYKFVRDNQHLFVRNGK